MGVRAGVVGHVEWVDFAVVDALPAPGAILHADEHFADAGGGGAVAAVQMRRLLGEAAFFTAVGEDRFGDEAVERLRSYGVEVHAQVREREQRRGFTYLDAAHERTITVLGPRLVPHGELPPLDSFDALYLTGGDVEAIRSARAARVLVATPRALPALAEAGVRLDALVASANDPGERGAGLDAPPRLVVRTRGGGGGEWGGGGGRTGAGERVAGLDAPPRLVVRTRGGEGGEWVAGEGRTGTWQAAPLPGEPVDSYGAGDTFAAALTVALGAGLDVDDALAYAARCGAVCMCGRGPYGADVGVVGAPR